MSPSVEEIVTRPWGLQTRPEITMLYCDVCKLGAHELCVCSVCYSAGHHQCPRIEVVGEYAFCEQCSPWAIAQYSTVVTDQQKQKWSTRLARQLASWRETAVTTQGVASTLGLALGSSVAMVGQGTAAFVKGAVEGISSARSAQEPQQPEKALEAGEEGMQGAVLQGQGTDSAPVERPRVTIGDGGGTAAENGHPTGAARDGP